ncbi:unnamed protein product [Spirodela intermedia]|uniref:Homeobox domain-containing protein n=1 Tax=Spirodela intermedia TaxID=51605 RepID=A0A7I8KPS4_SPIIN|nr:unnamed protein product [Spirodela intermedia]
MSQGFYQGLFTFPDGVHEPNGAAGNLLSDMFNLPSGGGSQAADLAASQIPPNFRHQRSAPSEAGPPSFSGDWYAGGGSMTHLANAAAKPAPLPQPHNFPGLNAATAMQLFLLNPQQQRPPPHSAALPHPYFFPAEQVEYGGSFSAAQGLRQSRYARAAQELLEEFCSVVRGQMRARGGGGRGKRQVSSSSSAVTGDGGPSATAPGMEAPVDRFEQQRKKAQLLSMLNEIDRRYSSYCDQMQAVMSSFDSAMGLGSAIPYTALARQAMSRHFRALKDAVAAQLRRTCSLLGEDAGGGGGGGAAGLTKGETPRLRLLEQSLWRQRSLSHGGAALEQETWRPQRGLPERSVKVLRAWLFEHFLHPYPSDADKHSLARQTGLSRSQVSNWFINARVRLWKPMVEEMYQKESTAAEDQTPPPEPAPGGAGEGSSWSPAPSHRSQQYQQERLAPWEAAAAARHGDGVDMAALLVGDLCELGGAAGLATSGDVSLTLGLRHAGNSPAMRRFPGEGF